MREALPGPAPRSVGPAPQTFRRLTVQAERRGGRQVADRLNGRRWSLPLVDRVLLVAT
jgi:hypothetical protein